MFCRKEHGIIETFRRGVSYERCSHLFIVPYFTDRAPFARCVHIWAFPLRSGFPILGAAGACRFAVPAIDRHVCSHDPVFLRLVSGMEIVRRTGQWQSFLAVVRKSFTEHQIFRAGHLPLVWVGIAFLIPPNPSRRCTRHHFRFLCHNRFCCNRLFHWLFAEAPRKAPCCSARHLIRGPGIPQIVGLANNFKAIQ